MKKQVSFLIAAVAVASGWASPVLESGRMEVVVAKKAGINVSAVPRTRLSSRRPKTGSSSRGGF